MSSETTQAIVMPDPIIFAPAPYDPTQYHITDPACIHEAKRRAAIAAYLEQFVPFRWFSGIDNDAYGMIGGIHAHRDSHPGRPEGAALREGGAIVARSVNTNNTSYSWVDAAMLAAMDSRIADALRRRQAMLSPYGSCDSAGLLDMIAPPTIPPATEYAVQYTPQWQDWPDVHLTIARDMHRAGGHCTGWERRGDHVFLFFAARNRAKDCAYDHGHCPIIPIREGFTRDDHLGGYGEATRDLS